MIAVEDLCFSYGRKEILHNVRFRAAAGECVAVLGNNGAGKSTLISCINRIKKPQSGTVVINGQNINSLSAVQTARYIAYMAQKNELSRTTVFDSVLLGRRPYFKWSAGKDDMRRCEEMLERLHLSAYAMRCIDELSGGEVQKVMLARALVQEPKALLLDEPTNNLDPKNQYEIMELVRQAAKEQNITVLMVLHDLNLALRYSDSCMFMKDGRVFAHGGTDIVTRDLLRAVYSVEAELIEIDNKKVVMIG